jgi:NAD-dependent dihydropyrimidine dehydrogenase PreA subunit
MIRKIVLIDEEKCNGCGLCVPACAEGAITIVDGKAQLAADNLCDGLGACLGDCPRDAIRIIERDAAEFDEVAVGKHLQATLPETAAATPRHGEPGHSASGGCPGSQMLHFANKRSEDSAPGTDEREPSRLAQWPVQLSLVPVTAPYFQDADLLIAADCVPFAYAGFHRELLAGKAVVIGCPKLDDNRFYQEKLTEIFRTAGIKSVTVVRMEVPCCGGIVIAARNALAASGKEIPFKEVTVTIAGEIKANNKAGY